HGATRVPARVRDIVQRIDPETYEAKAASQLALNEIGLVCVETGKALVFDSYRENRQTGAFILIDPIDNFTLAAGMVNQMTLTEPAIRTGPNVEFSSSPFTPAERLQRYGPRPAVVVSRSEPLLKALERALFRGGAAVAVLKTLPDKAQVRELMAAGLIL